MAPVLNGLFHPPVHSYVLRGTEDVSVEISQIQETKEQQDHGLTMTEAFRNVFSRADVRTPFILVITHNSLLMFSGPIAIIYYAVEVLQSEEGGLDKHLASIIVGLVIVIGGILGIFAVQKLPRVRLAMVSMSLMSICLAVLGGALYTTALSPQLQNVIKVTSVTVFVFVCNAGKLSTHFQFIPTTAIICTARDWSFTRGLHWRIITRRVQGLIRSDLNTALPRHVHRGQNIPNPPCQPLASRNILAVWIHQPRVKHLLLFLHAGDERKDCFGDQATILTIDNVVTQRMNFSVCRSI